MNLKVRLAVILLAFSVCLSNVAFAAGFDKVSTYNGQFKDVPATAWYAEGVKEVFELGLMNGTGATTFSPSGMFTLAEAATVAARLHNIYNGGNGIIPTAPGAWYQGAVDYCIKNGIFRKGDFLNYTRNATRAEMAMIVARSLPETAWKKVNNITELPDVSASTDSYYYIFELYNAGVLTGSDTYGMFQPYANITRAEVAAIVARCADLSKRVKLNLTPLSQREATELPQNISISSSSVHSGLILYRDTQSNLYGYLDTMGKIKIPALYKGASNFKNGFAWVRLKNKWGMIDTKGNWILQDHYSSYEELSIRETKKLLYPISSNSDAYVAQNSDGKLSLIINGKVKTAEKYSVFWTNGVYFFGGLNSRYVNEKQTYDIFDETGKYLNTVSKLQLIETDYYGINYTFNYRNGSHLFAMKEGKKYALATATGKVTEALYDSVKLFDNSDLSILTYGTQEALAGQNGIILEIGDYSIIHIEGNYAIVRKDNDFYLADNTGVIVKLFNQDRAPTYPCSIIEANNNLFIKYDHNTFDGIYVNYDNSNGQLYDLVIGWNSNRSYVRRDSEWYYYLLDGTKCVSLKTYDNDGQYLAFEDENFKWGLWYKNQIVIEPTYSTEDDALSAFGYYKIDKENGKPVVVFGNDINGFTSVIQYYKNKLYYDNIQEFGEGYYICQFNNTNYLIHP